MSERNEARQKAFEPKDGVVDYLISVLLWIAGALWALPSMLLLVLLWKFMDVKKTEWLTRLQCRVQILLTGCKLRHVVHPDVDPKQPYIFVHNHTNHFDYAVMANATPHPLQGVELEKHFKYPVYGWFMKARGTVPVKQGPPSANKDLPERIKAELDRGMSILLFPEGTRTLDGHLGKLRRGAFHTAVSIGAPIVPVTVTGMYETMHKGSLVIRPGYTVTVRVDAPIATQGLGKKYIPALMKQVEEIMNGHIESYWASKKQAQVERAFEGQQRQT